MKPKQQIARILTARQERLQRFSTVKPFAARAQAGRKGSETGASRSMQNLATALKSYRRSCRLRVVLQGGRAPQMWGVEVTGDAATVVPQAAGTPDLELTMKESVWLEIARGELAPLAAFVTGRVRVAGDCSLAKSIYRHMTKPGVKTSDIDLF